jgi:hypothetical protein
LCPHYVCEIESKKNSPPKDFSETGAAELGPVPRFFDLTIAITLLR